MCPDVVTVFNFLHILPTFVAQVKENLIDVQHLSVHPQNVCFAVTSRLTRTLAEPSLMSSVTSVRRDDQHSQYLCILYFHISRI